MGEDHNKSRIQQHVVVHVPVVTGHHHHCLLAWHSLANVALIVPPVHLREGGKTDTESCQNLYGTVKSTA